MYYVFGRILENWPKLLLAPTTLVVGVADPRPKLGRLMFTAYYVFGRFFKENEAMECPTRPSGTLPKCL